MGLDFNQNGCDLKGCVGKQAGDGRLAACVQVNKCCGLAEARAYELRRGNKAAKVGWPRHREVLNVRPRLLSFIWCLGIGSVKLG